MQELHRARWYERTPDGKIRCFLCPRYCVIAEGKFGFCGPRKNIDGELYSLAYGRPIAVHVDPIEKKPFAEFMPGTWTFSLGTYGCNLGCSFCQNYHLARGHYSKDASEPFISPEKIAELAPVHDCKSVAFTYNEPVIWSEYAIDIAIAAKKKGLATVLVSNGYITHESAEDLFPVIDAANIDMKGFSEEFYSEMCKGKLQPVLDAIKFFHSLGKHLEITNLIIPGKNDSEKMLDGFLDWTEKNVGLKVPIHFSAYHPDYKYRESPPTPPQTLHNIRAKAIGRGFKSIYVGNVF